MYESISKIVSSLSNFEINQSTLSGCIDIIVVEQNDGSLKCSPFHVRFGKLKILQSNENEIKIFINGQEQKQKMKLGKAGEGYFQEQKKGKSIIQLNNDISQDSKKFGLSQSSENAEINFEDQEIFKFQEEYLTVRKQSMHDQIFEDDLEVQKKHERRKSFSDNSYIIETTEKKNTIWSWSWGQMPQQQNQNSELLQSIQETKDQKIPQQEQTSILSRFKGIFNKNKIEETQIQKEIKDVQVDQEFQLEIKMQDDLLQISQKEQNIFDNQVIEQNEKLNDESNQFKDIQEEQDEEDDENLVELSLCGHLIKKNSEDINDIFEQNKISFETFIQNPLEIINNPQLLIKVDDRLYEWKIAAPLIVSLMAFKQPLPEKVLEKMSVKQTSIWRNWFSTSKPGQPKQEYNDKQDTKKQKSMPVSPTKMDLKPEINSFNNKMNLSDHGSDVTLSNNRKSLRPNSEILKSFRLKPGKNIIQYQIQSDLQGIQKLEANIFLWNKNSKIVISDIDGTITKSDVLGQLMPIVGKEWTHHGITQFYANITRNNYQILYLTARAIGQSEQTRSFLESLKKDRGLPDGPVIMSPDGLIPSFKREVIDKKPEVFKIAALRDIKHLFQIDNPFYAGFGNRDTDAISYRSVGITMGKIFIINEIGQIYQLNNTFIKSYPELNAIVNQMFPTVQVNDLNDLKEEYNDLNFWKIQYSLDENITLD